MRGTQLSVVCPRCGAEAPPAAERFTTCAQCGMRFDATHEPPQRSVRRAKQAEEAPEGSRIASKLVGAFAVLVAAVGLVLIVFKTAYPECDELQNKRAQCPHVPPEQRGGKVKFDAAYCAAELARIERLCVAR